MAAFLRSVGDGALETVRAAIAAKAELVNAVGRHPYWGGRPQALHVAIETGRAEMFDLLLESGADPNGRNDDYDGWSPLMLACHRERETMRATLLARGARVGVVEALMMKEDAVLDDLLRQGFPATVPNGGSILAFARTPFAVDRLLDLGAPADVADRWGTTPVQAISRLGKEGRPLLARLGGRGVVPAPADLARTGDLETLRTIAASDPEAVRGDEVLMGAVDFAHHALARWLLAQGASPNARSADASRRTALHAAAWRGDLRMAELLVDAGADTSARDAEHNETPLGWAQTSIRVSNNARCIEVAEFLAGLG